MITDHPLVGPTHQSLLSVYFRSFCGQNPPCEPR